MTLPSATMQKAIYDALTASDAVRALVAGRVYDEVPRPPGGDVRTQMPYLSIGEDDVIADKADCLDGAEITITVHAWSAGPGYVLLKQLTAAVKQALDGEDLALIGHRLTDIEFQSARHLADPDGITRHGIVTFRVLTESITA